MSDTINDLDIELKDTNIGKKLMFVGSLDPEQVFTFSSTIKNIGIDHDRQLKNFTEVFVVSDEEKGYHPIMGTILVTKVMAQDTMWVPTISLVEISKDAS